MKRAVLIAGVTALMTVSSATAATASASATASTSTTSTTAATTTAAIPTSVPGVTIGPANSWARAVDDRGDVAGNFSAGTESGGFLWHGGKYTELGFLPGDDQMDVSGMNQHGDVVGESGSAAGPWHAYVWSHGTMTDLGSGSQNSAATAINDRGQIIGTSDTADGQIDAVVWHDGKMTTLPGLGGYTTPVAQNDAGLVVGTAQTATGEWHAAVWSNGKLTDLGPGSAIAVNSGGQVLVWAYAVDQTASAFLWQHGKETPLPGGLWSVTGMNDKGQVVGTYGAEGTDGFVWQKGAPLTDLGTAQPLAINDRSQILAYYPTNAGLAGAVLEDGHSITLSPTVAGTEATGNVISNTGLVAGLSADPESATTWHIPAAG